MTRQGEGNLCKARLDKARQGKGKDRQDKGKDRQGKARKGMARHGKARHGKAWQGKATEGKAKERPRNAQGQARQSSLVLRQTKILRQNENVPPKQKAKFVFFLNARLNLIFQVSSIQKQVSCDIICT
jgi:hypothetical protein